MRNRLNLKNQQNMSVQESTKPKEHLPDRLSHLVLHQTGQPLTPTNVLQLQRLIGNQAVTRLLQRQPALDLVTNGLPLVIQRRAGSTQAEPVPEIASGMDKKYHHAGGDAEGWLETAGSVKAAELGAYQKLRGIEALIPNLPTVENVTETAALPWLKTKGGDVVKAQTGYWIQHIAFLKNSANATLGTFKPKMCKMAVLGAAKAIVNQLDPANYENDNTRIDRFIQDLTTIKANVGDIAKIVGELTFGVDESGGVYILDVSPIGGQVGGEELAGQALTGIEKLLVAANAKKG